MRVLYLLLNFTHLLSVTQLVCLRIAPVPKNSIPVWQWGGAAVAEPTQPFFGTNEKQKKKYEQRRPLCLPAQKIGNNFPESMVGRFSSWWLRRFVNGSRDFEGFFSMKYVRENQLEQKYQILSAYYGVTLSKIMSAG